MITHAISFCIISDGPHPEHVDNFVEITILVSQPNLLFVSQWYWEPIPGTELLVLLN